MTSTSSAATRRRRALLASALLALPALALAGCAPQGGEPGAGSGAAEAPAQDAEWPRTIEVPAAEGGAATSLTIEAEPQAIAALDYESAEVLAELGLADRLVLVPEAVTDPALGGHVEEMRQVAQTFPVAMKLDPETVISAAPDLVVMSPRHGQEDTIGEVLDGAGMTSLQLPASWTSPETLAANVELVGEATGTEREAAALTSEIADGLNEHAAEASGSEAGDAPRVLVLSNQAGRPFVTAGRAFPLALLDRAGAQSVSEGLGIRTTGPITAEQIVEADPDGIVLIDMNGSGDRLFAELLANPAVAALPAASDARILRVTGREVQALGLADTVTGLQKLSEWVTGLSA